MGFKLFNELKTIQNIIKKENNLKIAGVTENFVKSLITTDFKANNNTIFLVLPNIYLAQKFYDDLSNYIGDEDVLFYPADEFLTSILSLSSVAFKTERLYAIGKLLEGKKKIVILNQPAAMFKTMNKSAFESAIIKLQTKMQIDLKSLAKRLVNIGYKREYTVLKTGEFSIRGSILDIYPIGYEKPFRIDFFDIEIEKIKIFDPLLQTSIGQSNSVVILPINELFYSEKEKKDVVESLEKLVENTDSLTNAQLNQINLEIDELYQKINLETKNHYIGYFSNNTIFDFVEQKKIYFYEINKMMLNEERMLKDLEDYYQESKQFFFNYKPFYLKMANLFHFNHHEIKVLIDEEDDKTLNVYARDVTPYQGNDHLFVKRIKEDNHTHVISIEKELRYQKLIAELDNQKNDYLINPKNITANKIQIYYPNNMPSFDLYKANIIFYNESDIYDYKGHKKQIKYKSVLSEAVRISDIKELKINDYVVHYDYGIGQYKGVKTMELSGVKRDYIHIAYYKTDYLYVPVDQVELILKYSASEGHTPTLNRLGTTQWNKTKKRLKKKLTDLSDMLLNLYAKREEVKGFSHLADEEIHQEFANDFEYVETKDQLKAINDVKLDMESARPMDRLICGDVGYGKTEVALRAAFKAVYSGKQVAYLVPTTVLARQHYHLFKKRFEPYGINVFMLTRFLTSKDLTQLLTNLEKGLVDIVIGTHRILSDDVVFKDLGLLVIDEEQRFGVAHKEKIKQMKLNVDALSLSATPIPRTLQMSLIGIKDLSMIDTPPLNRYPIQTHIIQRHKSVIKDAIDRELARGGQVFYLYNKVDDMELIVKELEVLVPEAKISFAHGKMNKKTLENVISLFIAKEFDVLVSTTIIETGIDIPNTNTLIIHEADRLGLSQLYQIRGRVGRSDKIAYAYLMYDKKKILTEEAEKRLKTIKDFQELGSGFKIAMRDLSIRGAGDILGPEQSGFIESVGLEMYLKLLEEVIQEQKGIEKEKIKDDEVILSKRHIDKKFIFDDEVRLEIHKRIATINNLSDANNLVIELTDRFGSVSEELKEYMYEKLFYKLITKLGVEKIDKTNTDITLILSVNASKTIDGEKMFMAIGLTSYQISLKYLHDRIHIVLVYDGTKDNYLYQMVNYLSNVLN